MSMVEMLRLGVVEYVEKVRHERPLWGFQHIPKTAGTSLTTEIAERNPPNYCIQRTNFNAVDMVTQRADEWNAVLEFARQQKSLPDDSKYRSWSGHLRSAHVQYLKAEFPGMRCFTLLREPVTMVISAYRYLLTVHRNRQQLAERYPTLWDYAALSANLMVKRLAPHWSEDSEWAVNAILQTYDFIGTVELFPLSTSVILGMMDVVHSPATHLNRAAKIADARFEASPELVERIRAINAADIALHRRVSNLLAAQEKPWWRHFHATEAVSCRRPVIPHSTAPQAMRPRRAAAAKYLTLRSSLEKPGAHRVATFLQLLRHLGDPSGKSLLDLGAGPCIFARYARDYGYAVTAVDARSERSPDQETLGSIRFVEADIRNFEVAGFDVILALGILYHLDLDDQIALLRRCAAASVLVVDTQMYHPDLPPAKPAHWWNKFVREGDYEGVLYPENETAMASVGNLVSFWHTEPSLLRLLEDCGFGDITLVDPIYRSQYGARRFIVARKGAGAPLG